MGWGRQGVYKSIPGLDHVGEPWMSEIFPRIWRKASNCAVAIIRKKSPLRDAPSLCAPSDLHPFLPGPRDASRKAVLAPLRGRSSCARGLSPGCFLSPPLLISRNFLLCLITHSGVSDKARRLSLLFHPKDTGLFGLPRAMLLFSVAVILLQMDGSRCGLPFYNGFYYDHVMNDNGNGNGEIHFNGVKLVVETPGDPVFTHRGANVTLSCHYHYDPQLDKPRKIRIKWSKLRADSTKDQDVLVAVGLKHRSFGEFRGRTHLQQDSSGDVSLVIRDLRLHDHGKYRCEVIDGLEDESGIVDLELRGVVFPYQPRHGRYMLNFHEAKKTCEEQDAVIASFEQLFKSWEEGLDWCNAGWLEDGTVQYPITLSRQPCGGRAMAPGIRSYGERHKNLHHFDVFCFSSALKGKVYYLSHPEKLTLEDAKQACQDDGAEIAKVGQLYSEWQFRKLDRCDAGWLADGSVRYPIASPRPKCGPPEPGVRSFGFPKHGEFGVYCYKRS